LNLGIVNGHTGIITKASRFAVQAAFYKIHPKIYRVGTKLLVGASFRYANK
jgi:hypothetical protein